MDSDVLTFAVFVAAIGRQIISMVGGVGEPGAPQLAYRLGDKCIMINPQIGSMKPRSPQCERLIN